ncbi:MAG: HPr family phosphocarrier protein [Bacilli bacterium]|nr:HPr family phosphocarrier protein [Bacilli bacterium]
MRSFTYTIHDPQGVHARPAGIIIAETKKFQSNVTLSCRGQTVDLKRIFALMGLCIKCGETVTVEVSGMDEDDAVTAIENAFHNNL